MSLRASAEQASAERASADGAGTAATTATANLALVLEEIAAGRGWASAPAFVVSGRTFTHGQVHDGAARAASMMAAAGVGRGDRVLLALPDGMPFAWSFLGAVRLGAVAVAVNPRLTVEDHRYLAGDCHARLVVCGEELAARFASSPAVLAAEGLEAALADHLPHPGVAVGPAEPGYVQYTSGTTGTPKGAVHRHRDPPVYFDAFAAGALGLHAGDVVLSVSKMHFAYGLGNSLFFPLLSGAQAVLEPGPPDAELVADLAERHQATVLFAVPTFYAHLVARGRASSFASLRAAVSAGEVLTVALARRVEAFLGCPVLDGLGSTEVGQTFVSNTVESAREGTVGCALPPYQVEVRDEAGRACPPGEPGILWVRGPTVLVEYLGRPEATAAAKDGEWLSTGDRARSDVDGFVHLLGRADDLEMVGGIAVAPREVEEVLSSHPAVDEVAVASVRDASGASRLVAFVVADRDSGTHDEIAGDLMVLARAGLAPYKVPRQVVFLDSLPRTATGKLRRFVLRSGQLA